MLAEENSPKTEMNAWNHFTKEHLMNFNSSAIQSGLVRENREKHNVLL